MSHLERLADWVAAHRVEIEERGPVRFTRGPEDVPNPSASLVVDLGSAEVELLLWATGEAEFNYGQLDSPVFEHVEVESPDEFDALMQRVLETIMHGGR